MENVAISNNSRFTLVEKDWSKSEPNRQAHINCIKQLNRIHLEYYEDYNLLAGVFEDIKKGLYIPLHEVNSLLSLYKAKGIVFSGSVKYLGQLPFDFKQRAVTSWLAILFSSTEFEVVVARLGFSRDPYKVICMSRGSFIDVDIRTIERLYEMAVSKGHVAPEFIPVQKPADMRTYRKQRQHNISRENARRNSGVTNEASKQLRLELKAWRARNGHTQASVTQMLGFSDSYLGVFECGVFNPSKKRFDQIKNLIRADFDSNEDEFVSSNLSKYEEALNGVIHEYFPTGLPENIGESLKSNMRQLAISRLS